MGVILSFVVILFLLKRSLNKGFSFFLIRYLFHLHFQCYPKSPPHPPTPTPTSWSWHSPVLGHIKFAQSMGLSFHWWPTRPSSDTYAARDMSSQGYWLVHIVVAVPFSSLGNFSSSSIGGRVTHPIADCDHPLLQNTHRRSYRDKIWSCEERMDHLVIAICRDPSHNQLPNADTIAYSSKILLKGPRYSSLLWDYAGA